MNRCHPQVCNDRPPLTRIMADDRTTRQRFRRLDAGHKRTEADVSTRTNI
jgi:hypothetical protein